MKSAVPTEENKPLLSMKQYSLLKAPLALSAAYAALSMATPIASAAVIDLTKAVGESITPDGIYWTFDEGTIGTSTTPATDHSSINGTPGNLQGTLNGPKSGNPPPVYAEGKFGNGVHITGTSRDNLDQNVIWDGRTNNLDASQIDMAGKDFTVGIWLKLNSFNAGSIQDVYLMERGIPVFPGASGTQRNFLSLRLTKGTSDNWVMILLVGDGVHSTVSIESGISFRNPNDLEWHHYAFTLQPIEDGKSLVQFYLDGETFGDEKTINIQPAPILNTEPGQKELRVGERNGSSYYSAFDGVVDDFFMTSGVHTFAIPEPSSLALLPLVGIGALLARRRCSLR